MVNHFASILRTGKIRHHARSFRNQFRIVASGTAGKLLYDETKDDSHRFGKNQRTGWQTARCASRWLHHAPRRPQGAGPRGATSRGGFRQPRVDSALLGHRWNHCRGANNQGLRQAGGGAVGGRPTKGISRHSGFLAAKRLVYAEFLSRLDQGTSKTPTACWRIHLENSPTACWRIGWIKFAATRGGNSLASRSGVSPGERGNKKKSQRVLTIYTFMPMPALGSWYSY